MKVIPNPVTIYTLQSPGFEKEKWKWKGGSFLFKIKLTDKTWGKVELRCSCSKTVGWPLPKSGKVTESGIQIGLLRQELLEVCWGLPLAILSNDAVSDKEMFWSMKPRHSSAYSYLLKDSFVSLYNLLLCSKGIYKLYFGKKISFAEP